MHSSWVLSLTSHLLLLKKQNFQEANGYCYWNGPLLEAVTSLKFVGHVTPATILVTADESSLETVRSAWARKVLRAPSGYIIVLVGMSNVSILFSTVFLPESKTRKKRKTRFGYRSVAWPRVRFSRDDDDDFVSYYIQ